MIRRPIGTERLACSLIVAATLLATSPAHAQKEASAEALFVEGRSLMQERRYAEACAKLGASYDLDPAIGTLLNLALCHEAIDRRATAWAEFRKVAALSAGKREDRVTLAREHEAKLLPLLSWITIVVPEAARVPDLAIALDGVPIEAAAWGTQLPVDPGRHVVRATAPGRADRGEEIVVPPERPTKREVVVPALAEAARPAAPAPTPAVAVQAPETPPRTPSSPLRTIGFVAAGAGIASTVTGAVFGVLAIGSNHEATRTCPDPGACASDTDRQTASDALSRAKTQALVSDVTIGAGVLLVVAGVYLVLTHPKEPTTALRLGGIGGTF